MNCASLNEPARIPWEIVKKIVASGCFRKKGRVLELGASKLGPVSATELSACIAQLRGQKTLPDDTREAIHKASLRTEDSSPAGGIYFGELMELSAIPYTCVSAAGGGKSESLQLEKDPLPAKHVEAYDVTLNLGTSASLLNQFHFYQMMHQATKKTGAICHWIPAVNGLDNHWLSSTGRLIFDTAYFNQYELSTFSMDCSEGHAPIEHPYFEKAGAGLTRVRSNERIQQLSIPQISILAVCTKTRGGDFLGAIELQTSVGEIPSEVASQYGRGGMARTGRDMPIGKLRKVIKKVGSLFSVRKWRKFFKSR